jgi:hypothetical protein
MTFQVLHSIPQESAETSAIGTVPPPPKLNSTVLDKVWNCYVFTNRANFVAFKKMFEGQQTHAVLADAFTEHLQYLWRQVNCRLWQL